MSLDGLLAVQVMVNELEEPEIETLRQVGMKLVERCGGLPLAIRVLGGLLCKKGRKKQDEWEKVLRNPAWSVDGMPRELNQALYLSYEDLPSHLKQCFLYHSLFSKTQPIGRDIIIEMWISEGFIRGKPNELEEIGKGYYKELILRNLIEPVPGCTDQTMCTMQDVVWSFAQYVAKEEALVSHNGDIGINKKMDSKKYRRVSIISAEVPESHQLEWSALQKQKKLRTLIIDGNIKVKPGNSLNSFSSLRTLRISSASIAPLVDSLCQLKHLRYLGLSGTDICLLPSNIYKMKFLQHIRLSRNESMVHIPANIAKLEQLTSFGLNKTKINGIPRGFRKLTNLRNIRGFPAHNDVGSKDWCSLEELGPLSQLTSLEINDLENVSSGHFSGSAKLESKVSLTDLELRCASNVGQDGLVMKHASQEEQQRIGEVFDNLKPPRSLVTLSIDGYFGGQLPSWLSTSSLKSLTTLFLENLSCCTQLPNGLCELPLQFLQILRAPAIECVSTEFLISQHQSQVPIAFPRLSKLLLIGLVEWKKWDWQEQVRALTVLKELQIKRCKLNYLPPGLSLHAKALEVLSIKGVEHLNYLGNLPSLVNLEVELTLELERIVNLHSLEKLSIIHCPRLKVLVDMPVLSSFELKDYGMRTLPGYLRDVKPKHLRIDCSMQLLNLIAMGARGPEWNKFSHIDQVKAYDEERMFYVFYNSSAGNKIQTNITRSSTYRGNYSTDPYISTFAIVTPTSILFFSDLKKI